VGEGQGTRVLVREEGEEEEREEEGVKELEFS
jgi:hypothetical protein